MIDPCIANDRVNKHDAVLDAWPEGAVDADTRDYLRSGGPGQLGRGGTSIDFELTAHSNSRERHLG
ncbi:hypothetical protein ACFL5Q_04800 [Planctomycetota bacterium]